jgi:hypothetical protein
MIEACADLPSGGLSARPRFSPRVTMTGTHTRLLAWMRSIFGGCRCSRATEPPPSAGRVVALAIRAEPSRSVPKGFQKTLAKDKKIKRPTLVIALGEHWGAARRRRQGSILPIIRDNWAGSKAHGSSKCLLPANLAVLGRFTLDTRQNISATPPLLLLGKLNTTDGNHDFLFRLLGNMRWP